MNDTQAYLRNWKIGFLGSGNLAQSLMKGFLKNPSITSDHLFATNRSPGKLQKLQNDLKIQIVNSNEELVEKCNFVLLTVKPQDLWAAIEPIAQSFDEGQIVISTAAGVRTSQLKKLLPQVRWVRMTTNTPAFLGRGVTGYFIPNEDDVALKASFEDLFSSIGSLIEVQDEDQLEALMVGTSSGTGFVYEMMIYWQDWLIEHGFEPDAARTMTVETFGGAADLANYLKKSSIEELQNHVASKKGVTAAGLESMRELEIERALRISFEKAALKNAELSKNFPMK